ncbi:PH domain-containing protein [Terribacillus saccharophilus]|uniref:PH domain-containing protein n=1 Tax=Terribacillus saccharophilus TaxID=361277 RepID=UPI00381AD8FB
MGFFSLKAVCGVCEKNVGWNRYKVIKSKSWVCASCIKKAGGVGKNNTWILTIEEIRAKITGEKLESYKEIPLKTANIMYQYCLDNNFGTGLSKKWALKHFKVLEDNLLPDEIVVMTFIGVHNYGHSDYFGHCAYAVSNKRIMIGQKKTGFGQGFITVSHNKINDITFETGAVNGVITIDTPQERIRVGIDKVSATSVNNRIHRVLDELRYTNEIQPQKEDTIKSTAADEIKKFKELLDLGAITEEEYDHKKKQLLNLS